MLFPKRNILVIPESSTVAGEEELRGVAGYARRCGNWRYLKDMFSSRKIDGVLGHLNQPDMLRLICTRHIPAVSFEEEVKGLRLPSVAHDHQAIGRLAAEHLLRLGFKHFGYVGWEIPVSRIRQLSFAEVLKTHHQTCLTNAELTPNGRISDWGGLLSFPLLKRFLKKLPLPAAVLGFNDEVAIALLDVARELGIPVPQQLAVMGIDNQQLRCEFAEVALTSVDPDLYRLAYEGAAMLDALLHGTPVPAQVKLIPPRGVISRQSTDIQAFDDPEFAHALHYLRDHALQGISVKEAATQLGMPRIRLERACRQHLRQSPAEVIRRLRLERAMKLLAETNLKADAIARQCGFVDMAHFSHAFRRRTGTSPRAYRLTHQRVEGGHHPSLPAELPRS